MVRSRITACRLIKHDHKSSTVKCDSFGFNYIGLSVVLG